MSEDNKVLTSIQPHEYTTEVLRTIPAANDGLVMLAGLVGESGEVVEEFKKHVGHGKTLDVPKLAKELGDVLWYIGSTTRNCPAWGTIGWDRTVSASGAPAVKPKNPRGALKYALRLSFLAHQYHNEDWARGGLHTPALSMIPILNALCEYIGIGLEEIAVGNVHKLRERYPDGFVNHEHAVR